MRPLGRGRGATMAMPDREDMALAIGVIAVFIGIIGWGLPVQVNTTCATAGALQCGVDTFTFVSQVSVQKTETFGTPFASTPNRFSVTITGGAPGAGMQVFQFDSDQHLYGQNSPVNLAESLDTSNVTGDVHEVACPFSINVVATPAAAKEFAVVMGYWSSQNALHGTAATWSISDTQGSTWALYQQSGTIRRTNAVLFGAQLPTIAKDTVTLTFSSTACTNDFIGGTIELFTNVQGVASAASASGAAASNSISITQQLANDFIVGGAMVRGNAGASCESVTLSAPTTTRQTDPNCAANKQINFASGDQQQASAGAQTFAATYGASTNDVILAADLLRFSPASSFWTMTPSTTEFFAGDGFHELQYTVPSSYAGVQVTLHWTCPQFTNVNATNLSFTLYEGGNPTSTSTAAAATQCTGHDIAGSTVQATGGGLWNLRGSCSGTGCSAAVMLTKVYFEVLSSVFIPTGFQISTVTVASMVITIYLPISTSGTVNIVWWAGE